MTHFREPSRWFRVVLIVLLLLLGVQLWLVTSVDIQLRRGQPTLIAVAAVLTMIRPVSHGIMRLLDRISRPSPRAMRITSLWIFVAAYTFLYFQAVYQQRDFGLKYHDEYSYRIQSRMLANGLLWMPEHPLAEHFQSFQLIAQPVYASIYFPGTALLNVPGIWLGLPHWVIPLLVASTVVALTYLVFTELADGVAGLLGALFIVSIPIFREQSIMFMSQLPALLGALVLVWIWIGWRKAPSVWRLALMGGVAGWLAITRPVEALVAAAPVAVAVLLRSRQMPRRQMVMGIVAAVAVAAPFLALQLAFNYRVTGTFTATPFDFYTAQVYPQGTYGFHPFDPATRPSWALPQVQGAYNELVRNNLAHHTPAQTLSRWIHEYLPLLPQLHLSHPLLTILLPIGILSVRGPRWAILAMVPLFAVLYFPYVFFIRYYTLAIAPAVLLLAVLGIRTIGDISGQMRSQILPFLTLLAALLTISTWPQFNRTALDSLFISDPLREIDQAIARLSDHPAIVLFRYQPGLNSDHEPVYNSDVTWPDAARVIRAHDLGPKNQALFDYYARTQPQRQVYLYDRRKGTMTALGNVRTLVQ